MMRTKPQTTSNERHRHTRIIQAVRLNTLEFLRSHIDEFNSEAGNALLGTADKLGGDSRQPDFYYALNTLEKNKREIEMRFLEEVESVWGQLEKKKRNGPSAKVQPDSMALVDKEDFDEWVAAVAIVRSAEQSLASQLHLLEQALAYLTGVAINNESNPVSPHTLLRSYQNALDGLGITVIAKENIYQVFGATILKDLSRLYDDLNAYLKQQGITAKQLDPGSQTGASHTNRPARREPNVMDTLASLTNSGTGRRIEESDREVHNPVASNRLIANTLDYLSNLRDGSISHQIDTQLSREPYMPGEEMVLDDSIRGSIDATDRFISSMKQDVRYGSELQQLMNRLEIPLLKRVIEDPGMLNESRHPTRRLLEVIDKLAPYSHTGICNPQHGQPLLSRLEEIMQTVGEGGEQNIENATRQVETLLEQQQGEFEKNLTIVVDSIKRNEAETEARETLFKLLHERVDEGPVATAAGRLLDLGWAGLLLQVTAIEGIQSEKGKDYLDTLDRILKIFSDKTTSIPSLEEETSALVGLLRKGFAEYPVHAANASPFVDDIETALRGDEAAFAELSLPVTHERHYLYELLALPVSNQYEEMHDRLLDSAWNERVKEIELEEWIVEKREGGRVRMLSLAWKNETATRFVFVDGSGQKTLEISGFELASAFEQERYALLEDREMPLVERTVHRMLKQTFEQIREESDHDELTGLLNRRGFERKIASLIKQAKREGGKHAIIILDIDQFSLINDLCGFEGGDNLLQTIANIIKTYLIQGAFVARTGDDEFGILVEHTTLDGGFRIGEKQRRAMENLNYSWSDASVSVTTSVGIALIDETSLSVPRSMKDAYSACSIAKQEGRNCSRVYSTTDIDFERRERLIKSVPVIEQSIQNNRLSLYAQLITPIFKDAGEEKHYEILLRVLDENNLITSPVDFIQAAEKYARMRLVDRWVLNSFFDWLESSGYPEAGTGGFSINLSGQSLSDETFSELIKEKISKAPIAPEKIAFEITETAFVSQIDKVSRIVEDIRKLGCKFYLDDFGSGYSSYSYLKDIPVDCVKIDGIFVKDMVEDKTSRAMVKSITEIAHFMDKKVIAEYVENEEILGALRELKVDFAQGYGIGKPLSLKNLAMGNRH